MGRLHRTRQANPRYLSSDENAAQGEQNPESVPFPSKQAAGQNSATESLTMQQQAAANLQAVQQLSLSIATEAAEGRDRAKQGQRVERAQRNVQERIMGADDMKAVS